MPAPTPAPAPVPQSSAAPSPPQPPQPAAPTPQSSRFAESQPQHQPQPVTQGSSSVEHCVQQSSPDYCLSCQIGYKTLSGRCVKQCPQEGYYEVS